MLNHNRKLNRKDCKITYYTNNVYLMLNAFIVQLIWQINYGLSRKEHNVDNARQSKINHQYVLSNITNYYIIIKFAILFQISMLITCRLLGTVKAVIIIIKNNNDWRFSQFHYLLPIQHRTLSQCCCNVLM